MKNLQDYNGTLIITQTYYFSDHWILIDESEFIEDIFVRQQHLLHQRLCWFIGGDGYKCLEGRTL